MVFLALIGLLVLSHTCEGRPRRRGPGRARSALREAQAQLKEAQREAQAQLREAQEFRGCPRPSRGSCSDGTCDEGTCTEIAECTDRTVSYCKVSHMILHPVISLKRGARQKLIFLFICIICYVLCSIRCMQNFFGKY